MTAFQLFEPALQDASGHFSALQISPNRLNLTTDHFTGFSTMAKAIVPHFQNDAGVARIRIGVREFMCVGASAPYDHPHVFLDMGDDDQKVCPYCSTLFVHDGAMGSDDSDPPNCLLSAA